MINKSTYTYQHIIYSALQKLHRLEKKKYFYTDNNIVPQDHYV